MPDSLEELIRQRERINKTMGAYAPPSAPKQAPARETPDPDDRLGMYTAMIKAGYKFPGRTTDIELPADGGQKALRQNALVRLMRRMRGQE